MSKTAIRPFHVNVPEAELAELRRRINATNSAVVGLSDGVTKEGFMTGIFVSICRYSILILVSLVLLGSAVTSTAQMLHRNGKIAFTSDRDGNFEVYTINPDGSDEVRLTNSAEVESYPT